MLELRGIECDGPPLASEPHKFMMPKPADLRYNWVAVRLDAIDDVEMKEIVIEAWRMVVPKRVAGEWLAEAENDGGA